MKRGGGWRKARVLEQGIDGGKIKTTYEQTCYIKDCRLVLVILGAKCDSFADLKVIGTWRESKLHWSLKQLISYIRMERCIFGFVDTNKIQKSKCCNSYL